jgi:4-amino-4-deoxy-L-arabinose transferase-like glycosyltransferase
MAVALLFVLGLGSRLWVIARTDVAARDSIGFIRYALRLEREPLMAVLRDSEHPPIYPATVMLVSWPVRAVCGNSDCDTMVLSCQLASVLMTALSIFPLVLLGRELGGRRAAWIAVGLILTLPAWLRLTSDGLSEGTFLFWLATALWLGCRGVRKPGPVVFAGCGLAAGIAYLARPEGAEVVAAVGVVLLARQSFATVRQPWTRVGVQAAALATGLLIFVGPYAAVIGGLSNKNSVRGTIGAPINDPDGLLPQYGSAATRGVLAAWFHESGGLSPRWVWAARSLALETGRAFQYVGLGLAIVGLFVLRPRMGAGPAWAVLAVLVAAHTIVLCRMASLSGYLSERHTLLFVIAGSFPAAAAIVWCGRFLPRISSGYVTAGLAAAGMLLASPALVKPLHSNRAGHKAAGKWLARTIQENDAILDPFDWAEFYAGRLEAKTTTEKPERLFVILEQNENPHSRLSHLGGAKVCAKLGSPVYQWPEKVALAKAEVIVYEVPGSKCPDPTTFDRPLPYRVGLKAASATAAIPTTAPGG